MGKTTLAQIIAVQKGVKATAEGTKTKAYHDLQKATTLSGLSRTYKPIVDGDEQLPPESTRVQMKAQDAIDQVTAALTRLFDVEATKEEANTRAKADVVVDDKILLSNVPATTLLFIEKQLVDVHTFISKLPVLDQSEEWNYNAEQGVYATPPVDTIRTKKAPQTLVKAPATDKHPAQVDVYYEDVPQGRWTTIKFSGALPITRVNELRARVEKLQQAVKFARSEANTTEVANQEVGKPLFEYIFA